MTSSLPPRTSPMNRLVFVTTPPRRSHDEHVRPLDGAAMHIAGQHVDTAQGAAADIPDEQVHAADIPIREGRPHPRCTLAPYRLLTVPFIRLDPAKCSPAPHFPQEDRNAAECLSLSKRLAPNQSGFIVGCEILEGRRGLRSVETRPLGRTACSRSVWIRTDGLDLSWCFLPPPPELCKTCSTREPVGAPLPAD